MHIFEISFNLKITFIEICQRFFLTLQNVNYGYLSISGMKFFVLNKRASELKKFIKITFN